MQQIKLAWRPAYRTIPLPPPLPPSSSSPLLLFTIFELAFMFPSNEWKWFQVVMVSLLCSLWWVVPGYEHNWNIRRPFITTKQHNNINNHENNPLQHFDWQWFLMKKKIIFFISLEYKIMCYTFHINWNCHKKNCTNFRQQSIPFVYE